MIKDPQHKAFNCDLERFWKRKHIWNWTPSYHNWKAFPEPNHYHHKSSQKLGPRGPLYFWSLIKFRMFCFVVWGWDKIGPWWLTPFELSGGFNLKTCARCVAITNLLAHPFFQFRFRSSVNNAQYLSFNCPNHSLWTNIQNTEMCVRGPGLF